MDEGVRRGIISDIIFKNSNVVQNSHCLIVRRGAIPDHLAQELLNLNIRQRLLSPSVFGLNPVFSRRAPGRCVVQRPFDPVRGGRTPREKLTSRQKRVSRNAPGHCGRSRVAAPGGINL